MTILQNTDFYKAEITNIMKEMIRIIDRLNEMNDLNRDNQSLDWPSMSTK